MHSYPWTFILGQSVYFCTYVGGDLQSIPALFMFASQSEKEKSGLPLCVLLETDRQDVLQKYTSEGGLWSLGEATASPPVSDCHQE